MKPLALLFVALSIISCNTSTREKNSTTPVVDSTATAAAVDSTTTVAPLSPEQEYIANIAQAHQKEAFLSHKAVSFKIDVDFGGQAYLDAKITMLTDGTKIRIDKTDGSTLLYDSEKVYLCPENASDQRARFDMFTWTYFFAMPYKLDDPGTQWELQKDRPLDSIPHQTAKLTFAKNTGDSPEDWYITYSDSTHVLKAAAYIVSFGAEDLAKAKSDPHAIRYSAFTTVNNIPFATQWEFYGWTEEEGMQSALGKASISDITFLPSEGEIFKTPEKAKEIPL